MFTRKIDQLIFASAIALSSGLALAATPPAASTHAANGTSHMQNAGNLAKQCNGLQSEFDQAISGHENMKAFQDAKALAQGRRPIVRRGLPHRRHPLPQDRVERSRRGATGLLTGGRRKFCLGGGCQTRPSEFIRKVASRHRGPVSADD